jgi:hypothetical protein
VVATAAAFVVAMAWMESAYLPTNMDQRSPIAAVRAALLLPAGAASAAAERLDQFDMLVGLRTGPSPNLDSSSVSLPVGVLGMPEVEAAIASHSLAAGPFAVTGLRPPRIQTAVEAPEEAPPHPHLASPPALPELSKHVQSPVKAGGPGAAMTAVLGMKRRAAVYDIGAHVVYLPNGDALEAHSGLGRWLDDPTSYNRKDRGVTPPNTYRISMREKPFHGVRALRLRPIGKGRMYGRDGMLAHTYMLGPNGQSNGCVSFKDYEKFLQAYNRGEIEQLIVVPHIPAATAYAQAN